MWMVQTKIAGIKTEFRSRYLATIHAYKKFYCDFDQPELIVNITAKDVDRVRSKINNGETLSYSYVESFAGLELFSKELWRFDAMTFHAATISVGNGAVAFTARSGTGKTTHMLLWKKLLDDQMTIINGDKPIIRFFDDTPYVFGSPWCGKEKLYANTSAILRDICFIKRSETNFVRRITKQEALPLLLKQIHIPKEQEAADKTMKLINKLLNCTKLWEINCDMSEEAAITAYNKILGGYNKQ